MSTRTNLLASTAISALLLSAFAPTAAYASEGHNNNRLVIYFTRHAEKQTVTQETMDIGPVYTSSIDTDGNVQFNTVSGATQTEAGTVLNEICGEDKCAEELSKQGTERALLLAGWFYNRGVTDRLDAVYATHKTRTQQTVMPTATLADLDVTLLNPEFSELNPESTSPSECSTLQAIESARSEGHDTILIAGHSGTLYDIMGSGVSDCYDQYENAITGLGLNTGNTNPNPEVPGDLNRFPKDDKGKVRDFGDIWKVIITKNGTVRFGYRFNLQQPARLKIDNIAR
ncbi:MAG: hypothetical protein AB8B79_09290 [Granulosicoccus sp.]